MLIFIRSLCFCMLHVSARTLSVMVLQGTRCISLSKQFPPTSVICPSVFFFLSAWSWVCLSRCLSTHPSVPPIGGHTLTHRQRHTNVLWPLCAHACWREQTLHHMISAGRWKIPFISFRFPAMPLIPLPFWVCCFSGKSCKQKKTLLAFRWPADQVCRCFQFLILVRSSAAADWACEEQGRVGKVVMLIIWNHSGAPLQLCELIMNSWIKKLWMFCTLSVCSWIEKQDSHALNSRYWLCQCCCFKMDTMLRQTEQCFDVATFS